MDVTPRDIATRAVGLGGAERSRYLDEACGHDAALRQTVERLLRLQDSVTIDGSASGVDAEESGRMGSGPSEGGRPERVGAYRVLDELGAGAMGRVFLAEQRSPRRQVALKVIRADMMTPERERRFDLEAEALARLRHPGIATIYEAGRAEVDGVVRPFFAMELVRGRTLDQASRDMPASDYLRLMASVCDAVEHAHRRGILHRDLKPANIVVDEEGRARVLDFGVARTLDSEGRAGELVGTVPYMSPEQLGASPDVDTRGGVYALGVILHEVLLHERPHDVSGMTVDEAIEVVREPARIDQSALGAELAAIVRKAIAPDREDRYSSAGELGDDIRRFMRSEPVEAFGGGSVYRARKFVRRNPGLAGLGVLAVVLLAGGVTGVTWQAARATRGWHAAEVETQRAEEALVRAEAERRKAVAVNVFMTDMLTSADPENALGREPTVRELLDSAAAVVESGTIGEPEIESVVRMALANTYISLGLFDAAEVQARAMVAIGEAELGELHTMTADARRTLAQVYAELGRYEEADALLERARPVIEALGDPVEIARMKGELARVRHGQGRQEESLALWAEAQEELTRTSGAGDKYTLTMMHNRGMALKDLGRLAESESVLREMYERRRDVMGAKHPQTLAALDVLAAVIQKQGRNAEAAPMLREVVAGRRTMLGDDHIATLLSMGNLGVVLVGLGETDEAEALTRAALEGHRRVFGDDHAKTLILMANLAYMLEEQGRKEEAADLYREAIEARTRSTGGRDPETWTPMNNLAMLYMDIGRFGEARAMFEELLGMCDAMLPEGHYYTAIFRNNYGACLTAMGEYDLAIKALRASHGPILATFGPDHERTRRSLDRLAEAERGAGI
jgi:tetratricopeptide (TPR) repeat protein/predicted Ser/Thr protein kinase